MAWWLAFADFRVPSLLQTSASTGGRWACCCTRCWRATPPSTSWAPARTPTKTPRTSSSRVRACIAQGCRRAAAGVVCTYLCGRACLSHMLYRTVLQSEILWRFALQRGLMVGQFKVGLVEEVFSADACLVARAAILEKTIRIPRSISVKAQSVLKGFLNKVGTPPPPCGTRVVSPPSLLSRVCRTLSSGWAATRPRASATSCRTPSSRASIGSR